MSAVVKAGLLTIAVPHGLSAGLDLSAADLLVASLAEVTLADSVEQAGRR